MLIELIIEFEWRKSGPLQVLLLRLNFMTKRKFLRTIFEYIIIYC